MSFTEVLGVLGFVIALPVGYIEWQRFRAKPDLQLHTDWTMGGGDYARLKVSVGNRGDARGGIRDIVFANAPDAGRQDTFHWVDLSEEMPVMLDPKDYWRHTITLDPNAQRSFTRRMLEGTFTHAILYDQDNEKHVFQIAPQPTDTENRVSTYGQSRRK